MQTAYVLVSPCKDEAKYIEKTLRSVAQQTVKPAQWVIVDDGSRDDSMAIVAQYQTRMPFIKVVHRETGARPVGPGVIQAFNAGLAAVDAAHDFICKFDVDLELPERYFETMLARMAADPRLGTCSGKAYYRHPKTGAPVSELCGDETSVGMIKFYRRAASRRSAASSPTTAGTCSTATRPAGTAGAPQPGRAGDPLHPPAPDGVEPEEHRSRPGAARRRPVPHRLAPAVLRRRGAQPRGPPAALRHRGAATSSRAISGRCSRARRRLGDDDFTRFLRRYQLRALRTGKREAAEWAFRERARALARTGIPGRRARSRPDRMILDPPRLAALRAFAADVHVIGSGPVGIVTALALADRGFRVLVLESGGAGPEPAADDLAVAESLSPDNHFEPHTAVARRLGGTSNLWAGRCVPFDPIDFRARPWLGLDAAWPIGRDDLAPWLAPALAALGAGAAVFAAPCRASPPTRRSAATRSSAGATCRASRSCTRRALAERGDLTGGAAHRRSPASATGRTAASPGSSSHIGEEGRGEIPAARVVLAAGGNASTRLLLLEQEREPARFGGAGGPLGRFYMGHLSGQIADVVFENRALHDALDYHVDAHGSYVRRRLVPAEATQEADAPRQRRLLAGGAADRQRRAPLGAACPRSSSRCRWRRSGGG